MNIKQELALEQARERLAWLLAVLITLAIASAESAVATWFLGVLQGLAASGRPGLAGFLAIALTSAVWVISLRTLGWGKPYPYREPPSAWWRYVAEFAAAPLWAVLVLVGKLLNWFVDRRR
jgi:hypothetical protein